MKTVSTSNRTEQRDQRGPSALTGETPCYHSSTLWEGTCKTVLTKNYRKMKHEFLDWCKKQNFCELVDGQRSTLVTVEGLENCSAAMAQLKRSEDYHRVLDISFRNYRLRVAVSWEDLDQ